MPAVNPADLRVTRWDLLASAGTTRSLRFVSPDLVIASLSVWTGGDVSDVDDLAGATEHPGVVSGGGAVAMVDLVVPTGGGVPLRLAVNGVVVTVGTLTPSSTGAPSPDTDLTLHLGDAAVSLQVLGAGSVLSVGAGPGVSVDSSDPANPVVSAEVTQAELDAEAAARAAGDAATQAELDAHEADTTEVHGIADTAALYRSGGTDVAVTDGGTGASDAVTARSNLGIDTAISDAIAALVDSSPAALDTLNELAAALGDDPNFATTLTNALAEKIAAATLTTDDDLLTRAGGVPARLTRADLAADPAFSGAYAPLASPALTGTPTAPTPAPGDNSTKVATTAFVRTATSVVDRLLAGKVLWAGTGSGRYDFSDATGVLSEVASDAAVTFTVPASGQVMVELSMHVEPSPNRNIKFNFHNGAGYVLAGPKHIGPVGVQTHPASWRGTVSGLLPGAVLTWTLHAANADTSGTGWIRIGGFASLYPPLVLRVLETADIEQKSAIT